jgi:hypothetical protein
MKIIVNKIPDIPLGIGEHKVIISSIVEGQKDGIGFFTCTFKNDNGCISQNFFLTDFGVIQIIWLLRTVDVDNIDIENEVIDTQVLLNKELIIKIEAIKLLNPKTIHAQNIGITCYMTPNGAIVNMNDYFYGINGDYEDGDDDKYSSDDLDTYCGDIDDFSYGGLAGDEAVACWLNTN